jgi:hypothetical protein
MLAESISSTSSPPSSGRSTTGDPGGGAAASAAVAAAGAAPSSADDDEGRRGYVSPCWQWNEAMSLLGTFSPAQLNNHAYAALLKVNERAVEVCNDGDAKDSTAASTATTMMRRHNGVRCAMAVLERMKVNNCVVCS